MSLLERLEPGASPAGKNGAPREVDLVLVLVSWQGGTKSKHLVASCRSAVRKVLGTPAFTQALHLLLCWVRAAVLLDSQPSTLLGFLSLPYRNLVFSRHFFLPCPLTIREEAAVLVLPALHLYRLTWCFCLP